jgi:hypothetical protein
VLFVRNGKETLVKDILKKIRGLKVPFAEIWILGRLPVSIGAYRLFLAHPEPTKLVDFDVFESYRENNGQKELLRPTGRGMGTDRTDRGLLYLPIP